MSAIEEDTVARKHAELDAARPIVTVCRSGARSAQAAVLLQRAGWREVANLAGGLLRWRAEGRPLAEAVKRAVAGSALATTHVGAREGMPTAAELDEFLAAR